MSETPSCLWRAAGEKLDNRVARLLNEMKHAVAQNMKSEGQKGAKTWAVKGSEPTHQEITLALHRLVSGECPTGSGNSSRLQFEFFDGSSSGKLQVSNILRPHPSKFPTERECLCVATVSFRHLNYDGHTDLYLIRDREKRSLGDQATEGKAYDRMTEILQDPALVRNFRGIRLFQTGLEPVVVGVYRALLDHLHASRKAGTEVLPLLPHFFVPEDGKGRQNRDEKNVWW